MNYKNNTTWNIINSLALSSVLLLIAYLHFWHVDSNYIIPLLITILALAVQFVYHDYLRVYGILSILWGYIYVFTSGKLFGIVLYLSGLAFFAKKGVFEKRGYLKLSFFLFFLILDIVSLCRFGLGFMLNTLLEFLGLLLFLLINLLLFEDKVHFFYNLKKEYFYSPLTTLTTNEVYIAELLSKGYKFSQIAEELSVSESTVKRTSQKIYAKFEAKNKQEFIDKYLEQKNL